MTTISGWAFLPEKQTKASYASRKCMVNEANAREREMIKREERQTQQYLKGLI